MSRYYRMVISVEGYQKSKVTSVKKALHREWDFDEFWDITDDILTGSGESNLCGGEGEEEFAERIARAVFLANKAQCTVNVSATYMEELPYQDYCFDAEDYERLTAEACDA